MTAVRLRDENSTELRPGQAHRIYNTQDILGTLPEEYELVVQRVARWAGVGDEYVCGVVERYERRLARWWDRVRRSERTAAGEGDVRDDARLDSERDSDDEAVGAFANFGGWPRAVRCSYFVLTFRLCRVISKACLLLLTATARSKGSRAGPLLSVLPDTKRPQPSSARAHNCCEGSRYLCARRTYKRMIGLLQAR